MYCSKSTTKDYFPEQVHSFIHQVLNAAKPFHDTQSYSMMITSVWTSEIVKVLVMI